MEDERLRWVFHEELDYHLHQLAPTVQNYMKYIKGDFDIALQGCPLELASLGL